MAKSAPKKATAKKSAAKSVGQSKSDGKRAKATKPAAKKSSARAAAKEKTTVKKAPVKKVPTKKATTKKAAAPKSPPSPAPTAKAEKPAKAASAKDKAAKELAAKEKPAEIVTAAQAPVPAKSVNEPKPTARAEVASDDADASEDEKPATSSSASGRLKVVTADEILQTNGMANAFSKKISSRMPVVEMSRGKEPIELHHRPLTKKDLAELRTKLEMRLRELTEDVSQMQQEVLDADRDSVSSTDAVESSSAQYEQEFTLARIESESIELSMVRRALAKMDGRIPGQEYGRCEATGIMISIERLRARPHARLCVAAVEKFERDGGGEEFGVERAQG